MKRIVLCSFLLLLGFSVCTSQEIGVRWGDQSGGDFALDAILGTSEFNRMHVDLSFGDDFAIDILWDLLYRPLGSSNIFAYAGLGPYATFSDPFIFGIVAEFGFEYRFKEIPIVLGGDWRPFFQIVEDTNTGWGGFGFNARFVF